MLKVEPRLPPRVLPSVKLGAVVVAAGAGFVVVVVEAGAGLLVEAKFSPVDWLAGLAKLPARLKPVEVVPKPVPRLSPLLELPKVVFKPLPRVRAPVGAVLAGVVVDGVAVVVVVAGVVVEPFFC